MRRISTLKPSHMLQGMAEGETLVFSNRKHCVALIPEDPDEKVERWRHCKQQHLETKTRSPAATSKEKQERSERPLSGELVAFFDRPVDILRTVGPFKDVPFERVDHENSNSMRGGPTIEPVLRCTVWRGHEEVI